MASAKQIRANRANTRRSSGPKTPQGRFRSSQNARSHGLSAPIDVSLAAPQIEAIVKLLEGEGIDAFSARDVAVKIVDFERNMDRQRTIHLKRISGTLVDAMAITKAAYEEDPMRARLEDFAAGHTFPELSEADETLREAAKWLVSQERKELAKRIHIAGREAPESLRYYRRASNQLLKALRRIR
jgi:hypothetical protein